MYARNLQFSANCIRFKLISIFCTQKGIDSDFLDSIVPFSAKIRRKERSSKLASRKTAKDSFILGRGGGGEREKRKKWSVGIALSPSFLPSFLGKITSLAVLFRVSHLWREDRSPPRSFPR